MVNKVHGLTVTGFLSEQVKKLRIAVIGDIMLDKYLYGEVKRISPEAPVPVTKINDTKTVLGGAANVAANLAFLECRVFLGGVTGDDEGRQQAEALAVKTGIDCSGLVRSERRETISKIRVVSGNQQMIRLDFEEKGDLYIEETLRLKEWLSALLDGGLDGIILSDYAKGVCSDEFCRWVIKEGTAYGVPVLVDPKGSDWSKYAGCDFITPNLKEMCEAAGYSRENDNDAVVEMAGAARDNYNIKNVVVTRSEKGITLVGERETIHSPAAAREVFDVSGAGDTVAAVLLAGAAGKLSLEDAVFTANRAAGIVVGKAGTYPVRREELLRDIVAEERGRGGAAYKIVGRSEAAELIRTWQAAGEQVVFTNGCFDILHVGHVTYLEKAKALGVHLVIGLNSDASVKRLKGATRPLVSELDRARVLAALACVDAVVIFEQDTPAELLELLRPDFLVKGGDYAPEEVIGREYAGAVRIIPFEEGYSTTGIVEKITQTARGTLL